MVKVTATKARSELFSLLKKSIKNHEQVRISTKDGDAVMMAEEDYDSLLETLELLSTPGVAKGVHKARKEIARGETYSIDEVFGT